MEIFRGNCIFSTGTIICNCKKFISTNGTNKCSNCEHSNIWHLSKKEYVKRIILNKCSHKNKIKILNEELKKLENSINCCICMDNISNTIIFPCGHYNFCEFCIKSLKIKKCPLCRKKIKEIFTEK